VPKNSIFGFLGPNGSGKSTTIKLLLDLIRPSGGSATVFGLDTVRKSPEIRTRVGYMAQDQRFYGHMTARETLRFTARFFYAGPKAEIENRIDETLDLVDLVGKADRPVQGFSGGERQRLGIAQAQINYPDLLILDEPFQGLDPVNVDLLKGLIRELQAEGKTVVLSAHQMNLVEALCDRILLINRGRAVLYGPLDEIKRRYAPHAVRLRAPAALDALPGVTWMKRHDGTLTLTLDGITPQALLQTLVERNVPVEAFEVATAPLEEIFISVVKKEENDA